MPDEGFKIGAHIETSQIEKDVSKLANTMKSEFARVGDLVQKAGTPNLSGLYKELGQIHSEMQSNVELMSQWKRLEENSVSLENERNRLAIFRKQLTSETTALIKAEGKYGKDSSQYQKKLGSVENIQSSIAASEKLVAKYESIEQSLGDAKRAGEEFLSVLKNIETTASQRIRMAEIPINGKTDAENEIEILKARNDLIEQGKQLLAQYEAQVAVVGSSITDFEKFGETQSMAELTQAFVSAPESNGVDEMTAVLWEFGAQLRNNQDIVNSWGESVTSAVSSVEGEFETVTATVSGSTPANAEDTLITGTDKVNEDLETVEAEVSSVKDAANTPTDILLNTEETKTGVTEVISTINDLKEQLKEMEEYKNKILEGKQTATNEDWQQLNQDIEDTKQKIRESEQELQGFTENLKQVSQNSDGGATNDMFASLFTTIANSNGALSLLKNLLHAVGVSAVEAGNMSAAGLAAATAGLSLVIAAVTTILTTLSSIKSKIIDLAHSAISAVKKACQTIIDFIQNIRNSITKVLDKIKKSFEKTFSGNTFKRNLTTLLKYTLGVRSLYFAFRKLRAAVTEGLNNLVQFQSATNETNAQMTEFKTSLLYLKNAWGAAFAPVINVVMPILTGLIDLLARVANAIARFVAALTGQETVIQALRVSVGDYADSLGGAGGKAKKAADEQKKLNDRLAQFDDLNVLGKDKEDEDTGSGGGGGGANMPSIDDMFERIATPFNEFAERLRKLWEAEDFFGMGELIANSLKSAIDKADEWVNKEGREKLLKIAEHIGDFIDGFLSVEGLGKSIGTLLGDAIALGIDFVNKIITPERFFVLGEQIVAAVNAFIPRVVPKLGELFGNLLRSGISLAFAFVTEADWKNWGKSIAESINNFFNEMNAVNEETGLTGWAELGQTITTGIVGILDMIITALKNLDTKQIVEGIKSFLDNLDWEAIKDKLRELWDLVWEVLEEIFPDVDWDSLKSLLESVGGLVGTVGEALKKIPWSKIVDNISAIIARLAELDWEKLGDTISDFIENTDWDKVGETLNVIVVAIGALVALDLVGKITRIATIMTVIIAISAPFIAGLTAGIAAIVGIIMGISSLIDYLEGLDPSSWGSFGDFINGLKNYSFGDVFNYLKSDFDEHWNTFTTNISDAFNKFKEDIGWEDFKSGLALWKEDAGQAFSDSISYLKSSVKESWEEFTNSVHERFEQFKEDIGWEDFKQGISSAWDEMSSAFVTGVNAIIDVINGFLQMIANGINSFTNLLNGFTFEIPEFDFLGQHHDATTFRFALPTLSIPSIPHLAQGAVIPPNREFMAVLGDQKSGTNIEAPLDTIRQAVGDELTPYLEQLINVNRQVIQAINNKPVLSNRDIGRANAQYESQQRLIRGTML